MTARQIRTIVACGFLSLGASISLGAAEKAAEKPAEKLPAKHVEFFETKIRPALVAHCYKCHSADAKDGMPKGGLRLDSREAVLAGGESGAAVIPGDVSGSLLLDALRHEGLQMPPGKKLPDAVIADFEQWVRLGAPDPREGPATLVKRTIDIQEGRKFWAFQPPRKSAPPKVQNRQWPRQDVDRFVLAALESHDLRPMRDADRRTLARRLYFDLIGLPPTPAEVEAFVEDKSPRALETLVDRLLDSPHFGERWGRHWLDVARYAESNGNVDNTVFAHAWRYRDYVIAALNADKPFDRFLTEQVAGDLLPAATPAEKDRLVVATGFLALGSKPRAQNNANFQMDIVAEQIEVTTAGFMGLTVACARCHDHKFDPIPTKDYYSLAGIFTSTNTLFGTGVRAGGNKNAKVGGGLHKLVGGEDSRTAREKHDAALAAVRGEQAALRAELKSLGATLASDAPKAADRREQNGKPAKPAKQAKKPKKEDKKNSADEAAPSFAASSVVPPVDASDDVKAKVKTLAARLETVSKRLNDLESRPPAEELAMGVRDAAKPSDCEICIRGESAERGEVAPRGLISVVTQSQPEMPADQSGRLQLAQWMASPQNPLTARVIVNRIWKHLFGRGIVPTVDNFGALGEKPSHGELLDHLALQFVQDGWSIKRMIRSLVLSRSYGLSSDHDPNNYERDPDNVYLWRHTPRRLDAEALRDSILQVSGVLSSEPPYGSKLSAFEGQDLRRSPFDVKKMANSQEQYRSVYLPIVRNSMPEILDLFDVADPTLVTGVRDTTTVPTQSLYFMNSPFVIAQARRFAERLVADGGSDDAGRLELAFRRALLRAPTDDERARTTELLAASRKAFDAGARKNQGPDVDTQVWAVVAQALLGSAEFRYVE